jgi:glycosyltransferase involved in cell wall biosynthesis
MKAGLVSVIIPTYNRYELVHQAIKSALNQTYTELEVIVINDCSTDNRYYDGTLEQYERTTVIHLPQNQKTVYNVSAAQGAVRQIGIERAQGEWIAFLDDDDTFMADKTERQLNALKGTPYLMCSTNMIRIHPNGNVIGQYFYDNQVPSLLTLAIVSRENYVNNSTVILHRSILDKAGPCKPVKYEDWELWLRCLQHTSCVYLQSPLIYYLFHNQKDYNYHST